MKSSAIHYGRDEARRQLEETGFEPAQARLLARLVSGHAQEAGIEMNALRDGMAGLKSDVAVLKDDVGVLKVQMAGLEGRMAGLEGRMDGLTTVVEALGQEVRNRSESLRLELNARMDGLETGLGGRIDGLEASLQAGMTMMKWMLGVLIGLALPVAVAIVRMAFT